MSMKGVLNNDGKQNKKPFFSAFVISANIFLSRVAGLVRDICFARFLGTGIVAEAFYVAFRLPNTFRRIFADGAMSNVFVPFFSTKVKDDKVRARIFAGHVMILLTLALTVLTIIMEIFMPTVVRLINPGFLNDAEKFNLAVNLSRIAFPYIICISIAALFGGILNSIGSFWQFASVSTFMNLTLALGLILFNSLFHNAGQCLCWMLILSGILQVLFLSYSCVRRAVFPSFHRAHGEKGDVKSFLVKLLPAVISSGILQINIFVDNIFASYFHGTIAHLYYADRIGQFPLSLIGYSLSIAILPTLSLAFASKNHDEIKHTQITSFMIAAFFAIPAALLISTLSAPFIELMYERGEFTSADTQIVATMLSIYAMSIPFNILSKILFVCFYAQKNTKTPLQIGIFSLCFNVISNLILFHVVGKYCVIISTTLSEVLSSLLTAFLLYKQGNLFGSKALFVHCIKVLLISISSCVIVLTLAKFIPILIALGVAGMSHFGLCLVLKVVDLEMLKSIVKKKK